MALEHVPQNEQEAKEFFFRSINRREGEPADDWEAVLTALPWQPGYGPGFRPDASFPYFGFTKMQGASVRPRIFLPTSQPDENNFYTRQIQVIVRVNEDNGPKPTHIWAWKYESGREYTPIAGSTGGNTGGNGGGNSGGGTDNSTDIAALKSAIDSLRKDVQDAKYAAEEAKQEATKARERAEAAEAKADKAVQPGHPVKVRGSVGITEALRSTKVTWTGVVDGEGVKLP